MLVVGRESGEKMHQSQQHVGATLHCEKKVLDQRTVQALQKHAGATSVTVNLKVCQQLTYGGYIALIQWQKSLPAAERVRLVIHYPRLWQQAGALRLWEYVSLITAFEALPGAPAIAPLQPTSKNILNSEPEAIPA